MTTRARAFPIFVLAASALVLGGALLSQYWGGLAPCELCLKERWPWIAAIAISLVATTTSRRPTSPRIALMLAAVFVIGSALAFYHVGVEQHWFAGPSACTAAAGTADHSGSAEGAAASSTAGALRRAGVVAVRRSRLPAGTSSPRWRWSASASRCCSGFAALGAAGSAGGSRERRSPPPVARRPCTGDGDRAHAAGRSRR